jgi:hypothetical protein
MAQIKNESNKGNSIAFMIAAGLLIVLVILYLML